METAPAPVEVRHLRYFAAVADELHFGRAAERLHMAQSPLSHQIRQLERRLGVVLLDRHHHVVGLTDAGRVFLDEARRLLADLDRAVERTRRAGRGEVGSLTVGYVAEMGPDLLAATLRRHRVRHADVTVDLVQGSGSQLLDDLRRGLVDVAFVRAPAGHDGLEYRSLIEEPLRLARPTGGDHPADGRPPSPPVRLADLQGHTMVTLTHRAAPGLRRDVDEACRQAGFEPSVAREAASLTALLLLVAAGSGAALVPAGVVARYPVPGVDFVELAGGPVTSGGVAWRSGEQSPAVSTFVRTARVAALAATRSGSEAIRSAPAG